MENEYIFISHDEISEIDNDNIMRTEIPTKEQLTKNNVILSYEHISSISLIRP